MKRVGNIASNRIYNVSNARPAVPFNTEEEDPARDRFIRQKYIEKAPAAPALQNNTGSTNSDDYPPPAVPPKPKAKTSGKFSFGMRSSSSIFPMSSKARAKQEAAARSDYNNQESQNPSSPRRSKASNIFGRDVATDTPDDLDSKLTKLRDMGFGDERRNITVLKGLGGNMEKSIETLIRLEGGGGVIAKPGGSSGPSSRSRTPLSPGSGISFDRAQESSAKQSTNPFDMLDMAPPPAQPQSSQSTGSLAHPQMTGRNPYQQGNSSNPYGLAPSHSQYGLNQAFQNMSVSPTQPLFPNHTGGFPNPQQQQFQQIHQQSMTPPVPSMSQQYYPPVIYENPAQVPQQSYNPFMQQQVQHVLPVNANSQSNPYLQQQPIQQAPSMNSNFQSNPYMQQQSLLNHNITQSPIDERQATFYDNGTQQQQQQQQQTQNPFFQNNAHQQFTQYQQQQQAPQMQAQQMPEQFRQQTRPQMQQSRPDKHSILDLYNYPQLAPTPLQQVQQDQGQNVPQPPALDTQQPQSLTPGPMSAPAIGNRNPFKSSGISPQSAGGVDSLGAMGNFPPPTQSRHISQESVDAGWQSGRHSPDAWGTISARSTR